MSVGSLKKLFDNILISEFPGIEEVRVSIENENELPRYYKVHIGMTFPEMQNYDPKQIKKRARELSKYILSPNERLENIYFFDPGLYRQ